MSIDSLPELHLLAQSARTLAPIDWTVIGLYFVFSLAIAVFFTKRAGRSTSEFFLGGRRLGWFLAGTGMVATTFAADTPLAVTGLVVKHGIAGNWLWWNALFGGMLTVFFFARLWRRAGILTDVEFTELRYSGRAAAILRGFKAAYLGLFLNCVVLAWVNLAMIKIARVCLPGWNAELIVASIMGFVAVYAMLGGLMGVTVTDAFQFFLAMGGCIVLAIFAVRDAGGVAALKANLPQTLFRFTPVVEATGGTTPGVFSITLSAFIAYIAVQWWASWYPGAEPGGSGYVAQRMMSAKDEKNSVFATMWFMIAHYCVRPWPWILTALAAMVVLPQLPSSQRDLVVAPEREYVYRAALEGKAMPTLPASLHPADAAALRDAYEQTRARLAHDPRFRDALDNTLNPGDMFPKMMKQHLPTGIYGLLLAAFLAAYMSTIATQLNWGTSYLVNDLYRRFIAPQSSQRQAVAVSRALTLVMAVFSFFVTRQFATIEGAWQFILAISGGMGAVLILRWFWWRINAAAEIAAMLAPVVPYLWCRGRGIEFPHSLFAIVGFTTVAWIIVMYLTAATDRAVLHDFYRRVHPGGPGWSRIAREIPDVLPDSGYWWLFIDWLLGCVLVYASLFGVGKLLLGSILPGLGLILVGFAAACVIWFDLGRIDWRERSWHGLPAHESRSATTSAATGAE